MRSILTLASATGITLLASAQIQAAEPELRRVMLSTGGVGYFGFEALPDNAGRVHLTVPLAQVDDVLKSLTVLGGDGRVRGVSLPGPTPLADLFRDTPFGEADLADLPSLLLRLARNKLTPRGVLELIAAHPVLMAHTPIMSELLLNPKTPREASLRLWGLLSEAEQAQLLKSPHLPTTLRHLS